MKPLLLCLFLSSCLVLNAQLRFGDDAGMIHKGLLKKNILQDSYWFNSDNGPQLHSACYVNDSIYFEYNNDPGGVNLDLRIKHLQTYNSNGLLDKKYFVVLDTPELVWRIDGRYEYFYDQQGNNVEQIATYFGKDTQEYYTEWRRLNQFDLKNQKINTEIDFWNTEFAKWDPYTKTTQEFDTDGNVINTKSFDWLDTKKEWKKNLETNFKYIKNAVSDSIITLYLNDKTNNFELSNVDVISYPTSNKYVISNYAWFANLNAWKFTGNQTILLNAQGKKVFIIDSIQNDLNNTLEPKQYDEFSYDVNGNKECFYPYSWSDTLQKYVLIYKAKYFYSQCQTAINDPGLKQTAHLLSTLVHYKVQIQELEDIDQLIILGTDGKKLYSKLNPESIEQVSISNWPSGPYFVQVINKTKIRTEIFVKN